MQSGLNLQPVVPQTRAHFLYNVVVQAANILVKTLIEWFPSVFVIEINVLGSRLLLPGRAMIARNSPLDPLLSYSTVLSTDQESTGRLRVKRAARATRIAEPRIDQTIGNC